MESFDILNDKIQKKLLSMQKGNEIDPDKYRDLSRGIHTIMGFLIAKELAKETSVK
ncbi:hypothetical protein ACFFIX_19595 [Metabacillus herbersteinensis]|uniref:Uncharacterized protein n=1 Tax=Metabacillus herbersteinensis TaxID=283816 RepID=A0ABV6GJ46_9BACI